MNDETLMNGLQSSYACQRVKTCSLYVFVTQQGLDHDKVRSLSCVVSFVYSMAKFFVCFVPATETPPETTKPGQLRNRISG
jgi:hypothetical protein